jgi:hypothetical protein
MEFDRLTVDQRLAVHELEIRALRHEIESHEALLVALIDLLSKREDSPEFASELRGLIARRDELVRRRTEGGPY